MNTCAFCHCDAKRSNLYVSFIAQGPPRFKICSACYLVAVRRGYAVVYRSAPGLQNRPYGAAA